MARVFTLPTDRIAAAAPAVWPAASGTLFVKIGPSGWGAGTGTDHVFWMYGFGNPGTTGALLGFQRYSDFKVYVGWIGDGSRGGDQRISIADTGCFADGTWANHLFTWDAAAGQTYYVDNVQRGARPGPLVTPTLSGSPTSAVTIGNYNSGSGLGNADARGSLAFLARWNRVLLDTERAQLQNGAHPQDIPTGLVECLDLGASSPEQDLQSATTYIVTGAKGADDPFPSRTFVRRIASRFEPILLFHPDEKFSPRDPKWYLERSSLWRARPNVTDKANWGEDPLSTFPHVPQLPRNQIAALAGETFTGGRWLCDTRDDYGVVTLPEEQTPPRADERFLDFAGWEPPLPPPGEVTAASTNRHPALGSAPYIAALTDSRPWYYVEYLSHDDLVAFAGAHHPNGLDLNAAIVDSGATALLYYFLYPLHEEPLEQCLAGEGEFFATYAGEWSCAALLLDATGAPRFVGLTSRNIGDPSHNTATDRRVGMTVYPWGALDIVPAADGAQHPKLYVSKGTHGLYVATGPQTVTPFWGSIDPTRGSCGAIETADDLIPTDVVIPGTPGRKEEPDFWILAVKSAIPVVGWVALAFEYTSARFGTGDEVVSPGSATETDETGGPSFGTVLRPNGLSFPETAGAASVVDWNVNRVTASDKRVYDYVVSRPAQIWWTPRRPIASRIEGAGWSGRWGPRVTNDPNNRRAGGRCPEFVELFLESVAIERTK